MDNFYLENVDNVDNVDNQKNVDNSKKWPSSPVFISVDIVDKVIHSIHTLKKVIHTLVIHTDYVNH